MLRRRGEFVSNPSPNNFQYWEIGMGGLGGKRVSLPPEIGHLKEHGGVRGEARFPPILQISSQNS